MSYISLMQYLYFNPVGTQLESRMLACYDTEKPQSTIMLSLSLKLLTLETPSIIFQQNVIKAPFFS